MDSQLDAEWKPNGRPQSTIARSFSAHLDNAFSMSGGVEDLSVSIMSKQQNVQSQSRELEALEAKLREMEDKLEEQIKKRNNRLSQQLSSGSSAPGSPQTPNGRYSPHGRPKLDGDMFKEPSRAEQAAYARSPLGSPTTEERR